MALRESPASKTTTTVSATAKSKFDQLLDKYPSLLQQNFHLAKMPHGVQISINTQGPPLYCRMRHLAPKQYSFLESEFRAMLEAEIVWRSKSSLASPLHHEEVRWRLADRYAVPHIQDFTHILEGKSWFSKVDLVKNYHQIPVCPADLGKIAIATPFITL